VIHLELTELKLLSPLNDSTTLLNVVY